jgi:hypothetical protein
LRHPATTLRRPVRVLAWAVVLATAAIGLAAPAMMSPVLAADPSPTPEIARPPTCAERFPAEGPAGVDLRLGCIVGEVVGLYSAAATSEPAPLSTYAIGVALLVAAGLAATWVVGRVVSQKAGERMAPVLAGEWWVCAKCKSVNGAGVTRCYSCGSPPPDGPTMRTSEAPGTPQSFGKTRKSG